MKKHKKRERTQKQHKNSKNINRNKGIKNQPFQKGQSQLEGRDCFFFL